ncbi:hypothetical protein B296_00018469 [Ensete ventricosum]|uniref:Uncharacterized protein n=1 Tax=Ensete ventricosum TaxID=4639 RepID=A0A426XJP4_ENSVE|nr:hypothetical protein B296_00018469 [Ensete ventricosum]
MGSPPVGVATHGQATCRGGQLQPMPLQRRPYVARAVGKGDDPRLGPLQGRPGCKGLSLAGVTASSDDCLWAKWSRAIATALISRGSAYRGDAHKGTACSPGAHPQGRLLKGSGGRPWVRATATCTRATIARYRWAERA